MAKIAKKHAAAFYAAQGEVTKLLKPYRARCINQYFDRDRSVIETFAVYNPTPDEDDGQRYSWRGVITVWYGFMSGERASVNISFDEAMFRQAVGFPCPKGDTYADTARLLERVFAGP